MQLSSVYEWLFIFSILAVSDEHGDYIFVRAEI